MASPRPSANGGLSVLPPPFPDSTFSFRFFGADCRPGDAIDQQENHEHLPYAHA
jgi:hypothetical protein